MSFGVVFLLLHSMFEFEFQQMHVRYRSPPWGHVRRSKQGIAVCSIYVQQQQSDRLLLVAPNKPSTRKSAFFEGAAMTANCDLQPMGDRSGSLQC
jgi:hypothetical protein